MYCLFGLGCSFVYQRYTAGRGRMYPRDTENSILAVLKYDTCWYLIKTLEVPTRTNDAHVPDTGHLRQAFPSSFPAFFSQSPSRCSILSLHSQLSAGKVQS